MSTWSTEVPFAPAVARLIRSDRLSAAQTRSRLSRSPASRLLAAIVLAAVAVLATPGAASAAEITKLKGLVDGKPLAVNDKDEVLTGKYGAWANGHVTGPPTAPSSDPTATFRPFSSSTSRGTVLNNSGVVVGDVITGSGAIVPGYWNSSNSSTFTEIDLSALKLYGYTPNYSGFDAIDAQGDAVGFTISPGPGPEGNCSLPECGGYAGLFVEGTGGVPTGQPQAVLTVEAEKINGLWDISPLFEVSTVIVEGGTTKEHGLLQLIERGTKSVTTTNLLATGGGAGGTVFAENGTMVGGTGNDTHYLYVPGHGETLLQSS